MTSRSSATELASVTWWICPGRDSHRAAYDSVRAKECQSASAAESMSRAGEGQGRVDYGEPIFSEAFPAALRLFGAGPLELVHFPGSGRRRLAAAAVEVA